MSAQLSPRSRPAPHATPRPGYPNRGDGARARLTVAPEVARRRLRARLLMWASALVTVMSLFTLVAFHVFAAQSAFTLERLSKDRANEQLRYERLREQVAKLSSAETVIVLAAKLGMVQSGTVVTLSLPSAKPTVPAPDRPPAESSSSSYGRTKSALDAAP